MLFVDCSVLLVVASRLRCLLVVLVRVVCSLLGVVCCLLFVVSCLMLFVCC